MRVLHVVPSLNPEIGGPARSVPLLCRGLTRAGVEVVLYTTNAGPTGGGELPDSGEVERNGFRTCFFPMKWRGHLSVSRPLVRALKATAARFDIVHVHTLWHHVSTFSMRALRRAGEKYCVTPRGMLDPVVLARHRFQKKVYAWLWEKRNVESAAFVHFTALAEREKAQRSGWRFPSTFVVPNAIDVAEWENRPPRAEFEEMFPQTAGRPVVLFTGRISWLKNLPVLVRAFALLERKHAILVLAGPDVEGHGDELRALARELSVEQRLIFTGMLDRPHLKAAYAAANVFVLPSHRENFGMSAAEAMACGVPVLLSSGVDIAREVVAAGAGAMADSSEEIARAIDSLLRDEVLRANIAEAGKRFVGETYDWRQVGRLMSGVYRATSAGDT